MNESENEPKDFIDENGFHPVAPDNQNKHIKILASRIKYGDDFLGCAFRPW